MWNNYAMQISKRMGTEMTPSQAPGIRDRAAEAAPCAQVLYPPGIHRGKNKKNLLMLGLT